MFSCVCVRACMAEMRGFSSWSLYDSDSLGSCCCGLASLFHTQAKLHLWPSACSHMHKCIAILTFSYPKSAFSWPFPLSYSLLWSHILSFMPALFFLPPQTLLNSFAITSSWFCVTFHSQFPILALPSAPLLALSVLLYIFLLNIEVCGILPHYSVLKRTSKNSFPVEFMLNYKTITTWN